MKTSIIIADECSAELQEYVSSVSEEVADANVQTYQKEMGSIYALYNFIDECQAIDDSLEFSIEASTEKQKVLLIIITKNLRGIIKAH